MDAEKIKKSREEALIKIKSILDQGNPDEIFSKNSGGHYSEERFLVVWQGKYKGVSSEFRIDKTSDFYSGMSGYKAIYVAVGLFHEKQIQGYPTIERAFIDVGIKLCPNRQEKKDFFEKYAVPYNEKIKRPI